MVVEAYTPGQTFVEPGFFFTEQNVGGIAQAASISGVVGIVFQANDGPVNVAKSFSTEADFIATYGPGGTYAAQVAGLATPQQTFRETPNTVWAVRAGSAGTAAIFTAYNTASGTNGFTFTPWIGIGPNDWSWTIRNTPDGLQRQFLLYAKDKTVLLDARCAIAPTTAGGKGEAGAMVAAINALKSQYGTAAILGTPGDTTTLANAVSQAPSTAGTNPTVAFADYMAALQQLDTITLNSVVTDSASQTVAAGLQGWVDTQRASGMFVVGFTAEDPNGVSRSSRLIDSAAFNDPAMIYGINGWYDGYGTEVGARVAGRMAGIYAGMSLTGGFMNFVIKGGGANTPDGSQPIIDPFNVPDWRKAIAAGAVAFRLNEFGQVVWGNDNTTFLTANTSLDDGWKSAHRVKVRDTFTQTVAQSIAPRVGQLGNNNPRARTAILELIQSVINQYLGLGIFIAPQNTAEAASTIVPLGVVNTAYEDPNNPPQAGSAWVIADCLDAATLDHVYLSLGWQL